MAENQQESSALTVQYWACIVACSCIINHSPLSSELTNEELKPQDQEKKVAEIVEQRVTWVAPYIAKPYTSYCVVYSLQINMYSMHGVCWYGHDVLVVAPSLCPPCVVCSMIDSKVIQLQQKQDMLMKMMEEVTRRLAAKPWIKSRTYEPTHSD